MNGGRKAIARQGQRIHPLRRIAAAHRVPERLLSELIHPIDRPAVHAHSRAAQIDSGRGIAVVSVAVCANAPVTGNDKIRVAVRSLKIMQRHSLKVQRFDTGNSHHAPQDSDSPPISGTCLHQVRSRYAASTQQVRSNYAATTQKLQAVVRTLLWVTFS